MQYVEKCHFVECGVVYVSKCSCEKLSNQFECNVYGTMSVKACYNTLLGIYKIYGFLCEQESFEKKNRTDAQAVFSDAAM